MRSDGTRPSRRVNVSSSRVLSETSRSSCLGRTRLLNGQKRSPLPPARISAYIGLGMFDGEWEAASGCENCRFFFPNATYMVGDVFPDIHVKNGRATSSRSLARRYKDCHWARHWHLDGRQNQALDPSGGGDCACCHWRVSGRAVVSEDYTGSDQSAGIRVGKSRPSAVHPWRFRLYHRYGYLLISVEAVLLTATLKIMPATSLPLQSIVGRVFWLS